jgi:hypothetical protein
VKEFEMKRFGIFLVVLVVCVAGVGFYRGWFLVASDKSDDKHNVTFSADSSKMKDDEKKVVEKVEGMEHRVKDKAASSTDKTKDQNAGTAQPSESQQ